MISCHRKKQYQQHQQELISQKKTYHLYLKKKQLSMFLVNHQEMAGHGSCCFGQGTP